VFEKFYKRFNNSSEIAAVLAHEIAHNEIGHLTSYVKKQKAANEFGLFGEIFLELEKVLTPPSFNQKQEVQADLFGIDLVQVSKYDSCRSIDFWQRLADDERQYDSYDNLMNSHPYSSSRKRCLKNHIKFNYNVICN
jgi:predicted Zn-dependent protease